MTLKKSNRLQELSNKRLSVQISLTGLSFLITNGERTEVLHYANSTFDNARTPEEILFAIEAFFNNELSPEITFESVTVIYANTEYTIVPTSLFEESKASDYLKFNAKILLNDFIAFDEIKSRDLHVVYVPYVNINNFLFEKFGSFQFYHASSVLLDILQSEQKFQDEAAAFVHVQNASFDLVIQRRGVLELCNSFHFSTPEDFIYYLLFSFEQLRINPDTAKVTLFGAIRKDDPLYDIAFTYIRNISFFENEHSTLVIPDSLAHEQVLLKNVS